VVVHLPTEIEHILENLKEFEQSEDLTHGALMRRISLLENDVRQIGMMNADLFKKVGELRDQLAVMQNGGPLL
jgi:hypothetical protein